MPANGTRETIVLDKLGSTAASTSESDVSLASIATALSTCCIHPRGQSDSIAHYGSQGKLTCHEVLHLGTKTCGIYRPLWARCLSRLIQMSLSWRVQNLKRAIWWATLYTDLFWEAGCLVADRWVMHHSDRFSSTSVQMRELLCLLHLPLTFRHSAGNAGKAPPRSSSPAIEIPGTNQTKSTPRADVDAEYPSSGSKTSITLEPSGSLPGIRFAPSLTKKQWEYLAQAWSKGDWCMNWRITLQVQPDQADSISTGDEQTRSAHLMDWGILAKVSILPWFKLTYRFVYSFVLVPLEVVDPHPLLIICLILVQQLEVLRASLLCRVHTYCAPSEQSTARGAKLQSHTIFCGFWVHRWLGRFGPVHCQLIVKKLGNIVTTCLHIPRLEMHFCRDH